MVLVLPLPVTGFSCHMDEEVREVTDQTSTPSPCPWLASWDLSPSASPNLRLEGAYGGCSGIWKFAKPHPPRWAGSVPKLELRTGFSQGSAQSL